MDGASPPAVLSVRDLHYTYRHVRYPDISLRGTKASNDSLPALMGVSFDVYPGEFCSIVGRSGCGKSTLLKVVAGLLRPTSGSVLLKGNMLVRPVKEVAVVHQDYSRTLLPWKTVEGNVLLGLVNLQAAGIDHDITSLGMAAKRRRVGDYLEKVGLSTCRGKYPWQLSGGMQQRVAIARALAREPDILLLDEPFGSLDAPTRYGLEDALLDLATRFGITVLMITHDIDEAIYMSDRVLVMERNGVLDTVGIQASSGEICIQLERPRRQLETRADPAFGELRSRIVQMLHLAVAEVGRRS